MLTMKDIKAFANTDQKGFIKEAATVGQNASQGMVYLKMTSLALAAGLRAKADGLKSYTFDRAAEAFATGYFGSITEGSAKAMISALGAFTEAGMKPEWNASELAIRVFNERAKDGGGMSFTARAGMLRKLLKLDHEPSKKEYSDARPASSGRGGGGSTLKTASASLFRSVDAFGVAWREKLDAEQVKAYDAIYLAAEAFAARFDVAEATKPSAKDGKKTGELTMAQKRAALRAQIIAGNAAATAASERKGHKTIN